MAESYPSGTHYPASGMVAYPVAGTAVTSYPNSAGGAANYPSGGGAPANVMTTVAGVAMTDVAGTNYLVTST